MPDVGRCAAHLRGPAPGSLGSNLTVNKRGGSSQLPTRQVARLEQFRAKRATSCLDALRKSHYAGPQAAKTSRKSGIIERWYSNDMNDHADPGLLRIAPIHARQRIPGHTAKRTIEKASRDARRQTPLHTGRWVHTR